MTKNDVRTSVTKHPDSQSASVSFDAGPKTSVDMKMFMYSHVPEFNCGITINTDSIALINEIGEAFIEAARQMTDNNTTGG